MQQGCNRMGGNEVLCKGTMPVTNVIRYRKIFRFYRSVVSLFLAKK